MKPFILSIFLFLAIDCFSYQNIDSLAYEQQRNKINSMLNGRSQKFGLYTESLNSKTGIFGLKTKKDMQKSIDILKDIIQTDNAILKETKVLLDYKNFEQEKIVVKSKETDSKNIAYMRTINKLQDELEKVRIEVKSVKDTSRFYQILSILLILLVVICGLFIYSNNFKKKIV